MKPSSPKELKLRLEMLEKETNFHNSIFEMVKDPFFILDRKGVFLKVNSKAIKLLGYPLKKLQKMGIKNVVVLEDINRLSEGLEEMKKGNETQFGIHVISRCGERISANVSGTLQKKFFFITLRNLKERTNSEEEWEQTKKASIEKIRKKDKYTQELQALRNLYDEKVKEIEKMREEAVLLSYIDDLTGIYNHRFFIQQLTMEIERQKRYSTPLSLLMIDIDYFKVYNDTNGHLAGDHAIRAIAMIIQHGVRQTDIVARYGGEEFSAILINAGREGAVKIAERVRRNVAETHFPNENYQPNGNLTVSIGIGTFSPSVSTLTELIREADNALYRAKKAGRNRVEE